MATGGGEPLEGAMAEPDEGSGNGTTHRFRCRMPVDDEAPGILTAGEVVAGCQEQLERRTVKDREVYSREVVPGAQVSIGGCVRVNVAAKHSLCLVQRHERAAPEAPISMRDESGPQEVRSAVAETFGPSRPEGAHRVANAVTFPTRI